jgi:hypothetical protein
MSVMATVEIKQPRVAIDEDDHAQIHAENGHASTGTARPTRFLEQLMMRMTSKRTTNAVENGFSGCCQTPS